MYSLRAFYFFFVDLASTHRESATPSFQDLSCGEDPMQILVVSLIQVGVLHTPGLNFALSIRFERDDMPGWDAAS